MSDPKIVARANTPDEAVAVVRALVQWAQTPATQPLKGSKLEPMIAITQGALALFPDLEASIRGKSPDEWNDIAQTWRRERPTP